MRDKNLSDQMQKGINPINNKSVDKSFAKEVQATLPLTFYIYIFDEKIHDITSTFGQSC